MTQHKRALKMFINFLLKNEVHVKAVQNILSDFDYNPAGIWIFLVSPALVFNISDSEKI
jgi:hypothetical protein